MIRPMLAACVAAAALVPALVHAGPLSFVAGDLVVSVYGAGTTGDATVYQDNGASPITLQQLAMHGVASGVVSSTAFATPAGQLTLPQTTTVANGYTQQAISGEFGSSSEGILQRSGDGHSLTIAGYAVAAAAFDANPSSFGGTTKSCIGQGNCFPLAQAPSSTVQRVVSLVGANGGVDTSTTLGNAAFSGNNPRSVATVDGSSFYVSGQGATKNNADPTQGLFYAPLHATTATVIDDSYDTRIAEIANGRVYLSADSTEGSGVHENISVYNGLPTTVATATIVANLKSKLTVTSASQLDTIDGAIKSGTQIYLSPEQYFFASPTVLYVADSGNPKGDNNGANKTTQGLADGGLQKWIFDGSNWQLAYTLSAGLGLVPDTTTCGADQIGCGTTGLIGLTGVVVDGMTELFATNSTLGDLDPSFLYGISDPLAATSLPSGESFTQLYAAGADQVIRGVAFAPIPEPASVPLLAIGIAGAALLRRRR